MACLQTSAIAIVLVAMTIPVATANQYKVGGMDAWALPTEGRSDLYSKWASHIPFKVGDSLLFLYPPSEDSVVQLTAEAYQKCDISKPILKLGDGNSLFNVTSKGAYYFTSGQEGHCQKNQKFAVFVGVPANIEQGSSSSAMAPSASEAITAAAGPSASQLPDSASSVLVPHPSISLSLVVAPVLIHGFRALSF